MFRSGIKAANLIEDVKNEVDVALPIENRLYTQWINTVEQMLYTEIIKEQHDFVLPYPTDNMIDLSSVGTAYNQSPIRYEDIYTVYCDNVQLIHSTLTSGKIFTDTYYRCDDKLCINSSGDNVRVVYFIRPALKSVDKNDGVQDAEIMLPTEFVELIKTKLRGEAYRIMNENTLAANWLNEYNALVENFKIWVAGKQPQFGM